MALVRYTYRCGHPGEKQAPSRQRDYLERIAAAEDCWKCRTAVEDQQAAEAAREAGLPPLTGVSDKQIAYGETCRAQLTPVIFDMAMPQGERPSIQAWLVSKSDAGWWCELKNQSFYELGTILSRLYYQDTGTAL